MHRLLATECDHCNKWNRKYELGARAPVHRPTHFEFGTDFKSSGAFGPSRRFCMDIWVVLQES